MILESDNGNVVTDLNTTSASRAEWGGIIAEVKAALQCLVQVHEIKRDSNKIANTLVQMAMGSRIDAEWKLRAPVEILELLTKNVIQCLIINKISLYPKKNKRAG